ncbi:MAG: hypothetical protein M1834_009216 [Cirrosporium novae-zelandiae]|nr:MAG: hypothetical protein M1834_009216 [Cirrosporium novae-zelandiae]
MSSTGNGECTVCYEPLIVDSTPLRRITEGCTHEPDVCLDCLAQSITAQAEQNVWDQIHCPTCQARLRFLDIKEFATPVIFERYDSHTLQKYMSPDTTFRKCAVLGCDAGGFVDPKVTSFIHCSKCGGRTCFACNTEYHKGIACQEIQQRRQKKTKTEEVASSAKEWKVRPYEMYVVPIVASTSFMFIVNQL